MGALHKRIEEANKELNANRELVNDFMEKVFFKGNFQELGPWDYIYHGGNEYGILCSSSQIHKHLSRRNYMFIRNLHIGPVTFHPKVRYLEGDGMHPEWRTLVNFKWVNLTGDLQYISERYDD